MQKKTRWWLVLVVLAVVLLGGYYIASPWIMLARFKVDAQARKAEKMDNYVDFTAVRASLKAQLQARVAAKIGIDPNNPLAAMGMALANAVIDPVVVTVASPQGIVAMMNGENPMPGLNRLGVAVPEPAPRLQPQSFDQMPDGGLEPPRLLKVQAQNTPPAPQRKQQWRLSYKGLNHAVIHATPAAQGDPYLTLQRRGLFTWKVVDVQLGNFWPDQWHLP
ncbi:MAG: DUF2939 domain-containing protein [Brachymonas sp.]|nr:DUF2939 domain-containing protein [Brachymonas sp.]